MNITLNNTGKKFNREWIFQGVEETLLSGSVWSIVGGNGSGKSTLLQCLSAYVSPSAGMIKWQENNAIVEPKDVYKRMSWATPAVSLYDDFTLSENINFFTSFKTLYEPNDEQHIAALLNLSGSSSKRLKHYSSGMRQRVKLGLAILAETPLLLLDEPVSHLDATNIKWFQDLLVKYKKDRTIVVASNNHPDEIFMCDHTIRMEDYK
jgi:ABC-type multidrug transport system ATPase subunit